MYERLLDLQPALARKSAFLLGPRQTGKSTYLRLAFPRAHFIDLLNFDVFRSLGASSSRLGEIIELHRSQANVFVIDEIQKAPRLLDEVHRLIELDKQIRFILTGSSARKLRREGVNLLGGRATHARMHPIVFPELATGSGRKRTWKDCLAIGALPSILESSDPQADLRDYVGLYLKEEIQAEALARSIEAFSRFLDVAAASCGEQLNFTSLGSDAQVPPRTAIDYFQLLEDTLVGHSLPAFVRTKKRKAMTTSKFYLFDVGVANALSGRSAPQEGTEEFGRALEHYVFTQLRAYIDYRRPGLGLHYWRSLSKFEVDFVVTLGSKGDAIAIEIKGSKNPPARALNGLRALAEDVRLKRKILVAPVSASFKNSDGFEILRPEDFFGLLWSEKIF